MLASAVLPGRLCGDTIQANADDARFRTNSSGAVVGSPEEVPNGGTYIGRKYYGNGENNHFVVPFELPDLGEGTFSEVSVSFRPTGQEGGPEVNLWAIPGSRAASTTLQSDVNNGSQNHTALGTLLKDTFWDGSTATGSFVSTGAGEQATLGSWLNTAYANGDNAYNYVFLRLSSKSLWPSLVGDNAYFNIDTANSGNKPYLTYTFTPVDPRAPGVTDFAVSPTTMYGGATATLSWWVTGADTVTIDNGVGSVVPTGSGTVAPTMTTTYTLTATNTFGTRVRKATVTVIEPPTIPIGLNNFSFETNRSTSGTGAFGSGELQDLGLTSPTGWSVIATDNGGTNMAEIAFGWANITPAHPASGPPQPQVIELHAGAAIGQTSATPWSSLSAGDVLTLKIAAGDRNANAPSGTPRWPDNSFFGLSDGLATRLGSPPATPVNDAASATSWIGNQVTQTFVATPPNNYKSGTMADVTLSYTVQAADLARTGNVGVFIASLGHRDNTTNGTSVTSAQSFWDNVRLGVVSLRPAVISFQAAPEAIEPGGSATLSWEVIEATSVTIDHGIGTVPATGSVSVSPTANTTYTLTATNAKGTSTATTTVIFLGPGPYRYYRFVPLARRGGGTGDTQIDEFQMLYNGTRIPCPTAGVSNPGGSNAPNAGEGAQKANDNQPVYNGPNLPGTGNNTKMYDGKMMPLVYDFGVTTDVTAYRWCTGNDSTDRDPVSWRVEGSHDGAHWSILDEQTNYPVPNTGPDDNEGRNVYLADFAIAPFGGGPSVTFTASPTSSVTGDPVTLTWNAGDATTVTIDNGVGSVAAPNGSTIVHPTATTTYKLTATNAGGSTEKTVTVSVVLGLPVTYNFEEGSPLAASFQGWINVGGQPWSVTDGSGNARSAPGVVKSSTHDNAHATMILRSPEFTLNGNGDLIAYIGGGASRIASVNGPCGNLPVNSVFEAGFMGIALRKVSTNEYIYSVPKTAGGQDPDNSSKHSIAASYLNGLLAASPNEIYTVDIIDSNHGGWGWTCVDDVTIPGNTVTVVVPVIESFIANPASYYPGGSSSLSWSVTNADTITINNGVDTANALNGSAAVSPASTTIYTLTATKGLQTRTATATVTVAPPTVTSFSASPSSIFPGDSATLSWNVAGAASLSIDNGVGTVTGSSVAVSPTTTTTYTLTATNAAGDTTATTTVTVTAPSIASFGAAPAVISAGGSSTLSWSVNGAASVTIDHGVGSVPSNGSTAVTPGATTTYTLTATNSVGDVTAQTTVTVLGATGGPFRYYRFVPTALRDPGDNSVSIGEFQMVLNGNRLAGANASETPADSPGGEGPPQGNDNNLDTKWLNFSKTNARLILDFGVTTNVTAYRIGMSDDNGGRAPVSWRLEGSHDAADWVLLDVQTNYPTPQSKTYMPDFPLLPFSGPVITLSATPTVILPGQSATLSWNVTGTASSVSIDQGIGAVTTSGSGSVTPTATTTYTLTATGDSITRTKSVTVTVAASGLLGSAYDTIFGENLLNPISNLITATPNAAFIQTANIDYDGNFVGNVPGITDGDSFSVLWTGWFDVNLEGAGDYTFGTESDDGSMIYLDLNNDGDFSDAGELVVDNNGNHPMQSRTGTVNLTMESVRIAIGFYEDGGGEGMRARFKKGNGVAWSSLGPVNGLTGHFLPAQPTAGRPVITSFTASPTTIAAGTSATLAWETTGTTTVTISNGVGAVAASGSQDVSPALTTTYTLTATNAQGTRTATASVTVISGFASWTGDNGLTGANAAFGADPDQDGIPNGVEFVLGGQPNPANPNANSCDLLPNPQVVGNDFVFTYTRNDAAAYLNPTVEFDADLSGVWTTAVHGFNATIEVTPGSPADTVRVSIPRNGAAKLFARLKVVEPAP